MILKEIKKEVQERTGLDLNIETRERRYVTARYMFIGLAYKFTRLSMHAIGKEVGRDHSTVIYALDNLENRLFYEKEMAVIYDELLEKIGKKYSVKSRKEPYQKVKSQMRQRKRLIRTINNMTASELDELELILN